MTEEPMGSDEKLILGELRGQVRELVHGMNNLQMKVDGLTREVIGLGSMAGSFAELMARVAVLETQKLKDEGARGVVTTMLKSPVIGYFIAVIVTLYAYIKAMGDA